MGEQRTLAAVAWQTKGTITRRERFRAAMDAVVPWARLLALITPHSPKAGNGRPPIGVERMLRIYCLQQWFNRSDPQAEDAIDDSASMRRFAGVERGEDILPDETTILRFRHLLERYPCQVIKHVWGFVKVRYRGLAKNAARAYPLFALANRYRVRHLLAPRRAVRGLP